MEPCLSRANASMGCWGEHDWEGWVADELRAQRQGSGWRDAQSPKYQQKAEGEEHSANSLDKRRSKARTHAQVSNPQRKLRLPYLGAGVVSQA